MRNISFKHATGLLALSLITFTACMPSAQPVENPVGKTCGPAVYQFPADLYPFTDRCVDLGYGDYHYFDESPSGTLKGTVLMVHGNPTSSFLYRKVALNLKGAGYRVIAMDHYGFGESAKPPLDKFSYRPSDHAAMLVKFVDALNLKDVSLVVQDWGGPTGLAMAVQRPERIKNLVIMNTWAWQLNAADLNSVYGSLVGWSLSNQDPQNSATFIATGQIASGGGMLIASGYPEPLATRIREAYSGPFIDPATKKPYTPTVAAPTNIFARSILEDTAIFKTLGDLKPIANKPVYFLFGQLDQNFGALLAKPDGTCAKGDGTVPAPSTPLGPANWCTQGGAFIYPYVDRFVSLWNPAQIKGKEINNGEGFNPLGGHFIQEYAPDRIATAVEELSKAR